MHNPTYVMENDTHTPLGFWDTNGSPNFGQKIRPYNNQQQADHRVKLKENQKKDKYLDLARKLKNQ